MATITITYSKVTPESYEQGDMSDHGWVSPNEVEISLRSDCRGRSLADVARNSRIARARAGKFDWTLRDAVRFMLDKRLDSMRYTGPQDDSLQVDSRDQSDEYSPGHSEQFTMHIEASAGTLARLARLLERQGARPEWTPWRPARRAVVAVSVGSEVTP